MPPYLSPKPSEDISFSGTAPQMRGDTLGSDNGALPAEPTRRASGASPFGPQLPGPFRRSAGAGFAATPGSLGPS